MEPTRAEVVVAGERYELVEPSFRELLGIQRRLTELAEQEAATPDDPTAGLAMVAVIMNRSPGWFERWPSPDSLLDLRPSDVRAVMAAWTELMGGDGGSATGSFPGAGG